MTKADPIQGHRDIEQPADEIWRYGWKEHERGDDDSFPMGPHEFSQMQYIGCLQYTGVHDSQKNLE